MLGKEEWKVEAKSVQGVGDSKRSECCISKLFFFFNDQELSLKKITFLSPVSCADGERCQTNLRQIVFSDNQLTPRKQIGKNSYHLDKRRVFC